ncbi:N-acetylmuramic acid 6-phosphate etherase [Paenibacillus sp. MY03]|jgi:N-acetylmuramic acid 6-phosphate etherase|uniref:N-acetylmuramic acid 6-phosphate etherase n=1 Tax=Paenibacillus agaridevorans TaxID=171404 RepID=A0A2R5F2U1_9BACL|nr:MULTISPECIES: N-acetylmuramic acid 6-phosphate etherase [Paenibacillus]OUS70226.1 N-acetylmuramic acid 6-phosphate etherase [Paenibacillus sp. MY03]GBG10144.1 N-acetylmuramic acid 6-phosphate etherase [Paenibacillus agaridevorans]
MGERHSKSEVSEQINDRSSDMDAMNSLEILQLMNDEDHAIMPALKKALPDIAQAVDIIVDRFRIGGRLIYVGAGTSGRLAAIDALECPPTFGTSPEQVSFLLAGGPEAFLAPIEGAEDDEEAAARELLALELTSNDCVVALSASGSTPYCIGALKYAAGLGAATISVSCNQETVMGKLSDLSIEVIVGPELLAGSTRLKAGTAQKIVLNMLSTASMIRTGHVYRNMMVDMQPSNSKLKRRAVQIVREATGAGQEESELALQSADWRIKTAVVSLLANVTPEEAEELLHRSDGFVRLAVRTDMQK